MDHISQKRYIHVKLIMKMQKEEELMNEHIWMYTSKNAFNEFNNVVYEDVKVIITKYNTVSKWLAYILKYYYDRNVRLDNFQAIDETLFIT